MYDHEGSTNRWAMISLRGLIVLCTCYSAAIGLLVRTLGWKGIIVFGVTCIIPVPIWRLIRNHVGRSLALTACAVANGFVAAVVGRAFLSSSDMTPSWYFLVFAIGAVIAISEMIVFKANGPPRGLYVQPKQEFVPAFGQVCVVGGVVGGVMAIVFRLSTPWWPLSIVVGCISGVIAGLVVWVVLQLLRLLR